MYISGPAVNQIKQGSVCTNYSLANCQAQLVKHTFCGDFVFAKRTRLLLVAWLQDSVQRTITVRKRCASAFRSLASAGFRTTVWGSLSQDCSTFAAAAAWKASVLTKRAWWLCYSSSVGETQSVPSALSCLVGAPEQRTLQACWQSKGSL